MQAKRTSNKGKRKGKKGKRGSGGAAPRGRTVKRKVNSYTFEQKLRAVKLHLEEGIDVKTVVSELGVSDCSFYAWLKRYRAEGEAGLKPRKKSYPKRRVAKAVKDEIVKTKKANPGFGVKRISQWLRRFSFVGVSSETVRKTLKEEKLIEPPKKKPKRNPSKPRFFERSKPNQLWQTDIFTFRLGGKQAYLIGYIDDYSRFITGLGLFYSQTAANVLEVYRRAVAEYGLPREMLTDNGRQYVNWRGTTKFEKEMKKDKIHHFRSQPHHPQTLGKIERFWKTIWNEFLSRAQFDSFESARERIAFWVRWYNFKRPHQGIKGLCPADRYFEIQYELRKVIEKGIEENVLELALRGKVNAPFYLVGRMDDQSVVMHARKGKLVMVVNDGEKESETKEVIYDLRKEKGDNVKDQKERRLIKEEADTEAVSGIHSAGEMPGGAGNLVGEADGKRDLPGDVRILGTTRPVAKQSPGGYGEGAGDAAQGGEAAALERSASEAPGEEGIEESQREAGCETPEAFGRHPGLLAARRILTASQEEDDGQAGEEGYRVVGEAQSRGDPQGPGGADVGHGGGPGAGDFPQDLLRVGGPWAPSDARGASGWESRPPSQEGGPGERGTETEGREPGEGTEDTGDCAEGPELLTTDLTSGFPGGDEGDEREDNEEE